MTLTHIIYDEHVFITELIITEMSGLYNCPDIIMNSKASLKKNEIVQMFFFFSDQAVCQIKLRFA